MNLRWTKFTLSVCPLLAPFFLVLGVAQAQPLSPTATQQVTEILTAKSQLTAAQKKIDSNLIFAAKAARGELAGTSIAKIIPTVATDAAGLVTVDIKGTVSGVVAAISALGGQVISQFPQYDAVRAKLKLQDIEKLAADAAVKSISSEQKARTNVGALTSQGYISHSARDVVVGLGFTGAGVKVGVLSDSASAARVTALIASGDLGAGTTVLAGQAGSGEDEGAAMMEIVQDIAPGSQLYFATANGGLAQFAANITTLAAAGCTVIVDDIGYFSEGAFQDSVIGQAINTFVAGGGIYFSAAANSGNLTSGTSGTWEGDFVSGGAVGPPISTSGETGLIHSFGAQLYDTLSGANTGGITLKWSDPLGASNNDYDLFILDSTGATLKGFSAGIQSGAQDPLEEVFPGANCGTVSATGYCPAVGDRIVVVQFSGATRGLRIDTNRGQLSNGTTGSTLGHNAGLNTVSVAATFWNSAKTGVKPFTGGAANPIEFFSSDGPRRIFYNPNGTAITPGNVLFGTNGGTLLQKPDITAANGASSKTPGFLPFFGTSAAAPHSAGLAALIKSARPSYTGAQIKTALTSTALDNMAPGWDRDGGWGVVTALLAVQYALTH